MRGGKRKGAGRKTGSKIETPRNVVKQVRWTLEEWKHIQSISADLKIPPSRFIRFKTLQKGE